MSNALAAMKEQRPDLRQDYGLTMEASVETAFRQSSYTALRRVRCQLRNDALMLTGRLPSYFLKQVAQSLARKAINIDRIVNHIEVVDADLTRGVRVWRGDNPADAEPAFVELEKEVLPCLS